MREISESINCKKIISIFWAIFICLVAVRISEAQDAPVIHYSSAKNGPVSGWNAQDDKGASITIWAKNIGTSRGNNTVTVCGITLDQESDYSEWGISSTPRTSMNAQRISFWLKPSMLGGSGISVNVDGDVSNTYAFDCDNTGNIYFYPDDAAAQGWSDIEVASESMSPGDFFYLRAGTYTQDTWYIGYFGSPIDGTDTERITMTSYPGEEAILANAYLKVYSSYWTFTRLKFDGHSLVMGAQRDHCTEHNSIREGLYSIGNEFTGQLDEAMQAFGNNFIIQGNYVNIIPEDETSYPLYMCSGSNRIIKDNEIHGGSRWLIHAYDEDRPNCTDTNRVLLDWTIENNILDATNAGQGRRGAIVIQANNVALVKNMTIKNNIIYSEDTQSSEAMIRIRHNIDGLNIYNNIIHSGPVGVLVTDSIPKNIVVKNNILSAMSGLDVETRYATSGEVIIDNNLYDDTPNMDNVVDSNPVVGNPQFVSISSQDFHLSGSSPAIDTAITLAEIVDDFDHNPRPMDGDNNGTAEYDIGAYEYTGTYIPPVPDTEAPSVPGSVSATAVSATQIDITWNASIDNVSVAGYKIYRAGSQIGTSSLTSYSDTGLSPSTSYTYTVEAYDAAGNSSLSGQVSATTLPSPGPDTEAPSVPSGASATAISSSQISLSWSSSTDNIGVAGYYIYREGSKIDASSSTSYTDSGLTTATTYSFSISAYDAAGNESGESLSTSATTLAGSDTEAPTVITGLSTTASTTRIDISWNASTDNVGVTGYKLYRDGSKIATITSTSYSDTGLSPSTTYSYKVKTYDAAGNQSEVSSPVSATTLDVQSDSVPPGAPISLHIIQN